MRIRHIFIGLLLFISCFAASGLFNKTYAANVCVSDRYNGKETYCHDTSCWSGDTEVNYINCPGNQVCCAKTKPDCSGCKFGRRLYCSIEGGGNAFALEYRCNTDVFSTSCYLGDRDASCPEDHTPGNLCAIDNDVETGAKTFCAFVSLDHPSSSNLTTYCMQGQGCYKMGDATSCSGCVYGRREFCSYGTDDINRKFPQSPTGHLCPNVIIGSSSSNCVVGDYDLSCPNVPPPANTCYVSPFEGKETYCNMNCNGLTTANYSGCGSNQYCCVGTKPFQARTGDNGGFQPIPFNLCDSVPVGPAQDKCIACEELYKNDPNAHGVWTSLGCVKVDNTGNDIVKSLVRLGLGFAGGAAILIILAAAFTLSTSQGDPKKTEEAKQMITAAVGGLLFILFSMVILRTVGIDILQIPGF